MASYFLPSFLTGWNLASVSPFSLSANLQKRILSYLLKRTLGHLVDGGQLDLAQIDAGIGSGRIEIHNVRLDAEAINRRLSSLPIAFVEGQIGRILIQLPVPNFWSGELSITVSDVSVSVKPRSRSAEHSSNANQDLSASFASAASQLFVEDDEAQEIEQSIHESLDPEELRQDQRESAEDKGSLIATYVEALLTRLKVAIERVQVHFLSDAVDLSLKLHSATVQSSNLRTEQAGQDTDADRSNDAASATIESPQRCRYSETRRTLELQGFQVWMQDYRKQATSRDTDSSSSSDDSADETLSASRSDLQDMSQSIASLQESSASLYESAIGGSAFQEAPASAQRSPSHRSAKAGASHPVTNAPHMLFSLGTEPVVITYKTTKERHEVGSSDESSSRTIQRLVRVMTDVDVQVGNAGAVVFIDHISLLMVLLGSLGHAPPQKDALPGDRRAATQPRSPSSSFRLQRSLVLSCRVSSLNLIIGYDDPAVLQRSQPSLETFWARPSRSHPDFGHIRLRCDKLLAQFTNVTTDDKSRPDQPQVQISADDLGLFEHLAPDLYQQCPPGASRVLPVLILDSNLAQSVAPSSASAKRPQHDYASSTVDVFDWRYSGSAPHRPDVSASDPPNSAKAARFKTAETRSTYSSSAQSPYVRNAYGDRGWKLKARSQAPGNTVEASSPSIAVSALLPHADGEQGHVNATVAPVHVFLDVSLFTRLMPALRRFATAQIAALKETIEAEYDMSGSMATLAASVATIQASTDSLLDDPSTKSFTGNKSPYKLDVKISFVRIDVRTPQVSYDAAALAGRQLGATRMGGLARRSGILVLQMQRLDVRSGLAEKQKRSNAIRFAPPLGEGGRNGEPTVTSQCSVESISAYLALPSQSRALVLAMIEAIQDDTEASGPSVSPRTRLLPRVQISRIAETSAGPSFGSSEQEAEDRCSVSIPSVKLELGKSQLDSLQYMADDLTQSIHLWTSDKLTDSDTLDAEDLKILGSRFFGSRAGMSVMSSSTDSTETARASTRNSSLLVIISEASIRLWLPHLAPGAHLPGQEPAESPKSLLLTASDFRLSFDSDKARNITRIEMRVPQMQLRAESGSAAEEVLSSRLAYRTMEASLDDRRHDNMLLLVLEAYAEPCTSYREQNVDLTLSSVTLSPSFDPELVPRIKRFLKAPAGVFENVEPNEVTRISFKARDCSVLVAPPTTTSRAAVAIGELSIKTKLTSHAPKTSIKLAIGDLDLYAAEGELSGSASSRATAAKSAAEHWTRRNYARLLHIPESKGSVHLNTLTRPEIDVKITKLRAKLQATADTLDVVSAVVGAMTASQGPASKVPAAPPTRQDGSLASSADTELSSHDAAGARQTAAKLSSMAAQDPDRMADLLSGIEDDAYHLAAPLAVGADLVDDDVPSDAAFLGAKGEGRYHPEIVETTLDSDEFFGGESVASLSLLSPRTDTVLFADEDVTIRLLDPKGICPVQEYFTDPDLRPQVDSALGTTASSLRVRVSNFDLSVRLHAGYDWASTRKAVQQEAKLVRKRLQKIKQLLAEGQVPDDSVEAATSHLLDSIHMSLPTIPAEMDADAMMQAVEDELGDPSDAVSTADSDATASWQALPNARRGQQTASRSSKGPPATNASHNKLQRSQRSMIDFNFRGLDVEYDKADPSQSGHVVSRLAVNARRVEIIDNIKTSTWRTFLTEMQDQNAALRHDAEGKMAKVEIVHVRPQGGTLDGDHAAEAPEVRMRAKIAPLRLHVDQDALDFLKKYFMFKVPGQKEPAPSASSTGPPLPFVQFAEVLPIKIKLDYKPKRVDYNLLRQGKTIELMNFFHFEGSEMVLRHITLRGINGWARLFDTLNDIWTPDVKANQLADFLSGLGPIRSLVNVGAGLADLVLLPIEQYHKDGRVLRGVQRGATSFAKSTALEAVKLGARLATGTQVILEQAEHILGGEMPTALTARAVGPDSSGESYESLSESIMVESMTSEAGVQADNLVSRYASQPDNMRDALSQAYSGLTEGLTSAAQTILAIPMEVYEPDPSGAAGATSGGTSGGGSGRPVVKAVPIAILKGARGATQAIAKTMQGVQVTLGDMENVKEGKYKQPSRGR
ncbi:Vacuolar protein sorting-associated protein 13A N-terminal domain protein [Kalmanozyma brasiliensis GHG001]|uniref:Vacuolar protein sorting-associated protein 13A N-terminal domain protein n=1 Tax=Kalmanozyma brasiliensis (strain GHG001) TaxID=1365824 RepID=UPI0028682954|nr:Vacuolar protein sorting-associated protein 13A N-terminal domain protein [Kalmanozyma brasiliensis GHG001]EST06234.2 Vacuolar protein sorting-associated protein 13A N-terminal domain protein [Kalmanozyma brasiliensis GHG001]